MAEPRGSARITLTTSELQDYYAHIGAKVGGLRDGAAIRDQRPSEISAEIAGLLGLQDRIGEAVRKSQEPKEPPAAGA